MQETGKLKNGTNSYNKYQQASQLSDLLISFPNPFLYSFSLLLSLSLRSFSSLILRAFLFRSLSLSSLILGGDIIQSTSHCRVVSFAVIPTIQEGPRTDCYL